MLKVQISYYLKIKFGLAQITNIYLLIYQLRSKSTDLSVGTCTSTCRNRCRRWYEIGKIYLLDQ